MEGLGMVVFPGNTFTPYQRIPDTEGKMVIYQGVFEPFINSSKCIRVGLAYLTGKSFSTEPRLGGLACLINKRPIVTRNVRVLVGSVIVAKAKVLHRLEKWGEIFYETIYLPEIYMTISDRLSYREQVRKVIGDPCKVKGAHIGAGCYGAVYKENIGSLVWALKIAKIKEEAVSTPFSKDFSSWHEYNLWNDILQVLLEKRACPNFPLLYKAEACPQGTLNLHMELASGTLKTWFSSTRTEREILSCFFQILAGLHAIQLFGQIVHYDIKKENILYYTLENGGYWKYTIRGVNYYVPNEGYLFVISDFGLSRPLSPEYKLYKNPDDIYYRLGHRLAIISNGKFVPLVTESSIEKNTKLITWENGMRVKGSSFVVSRKSESIPDNPPLEYFKDVEKAPPFEFYNDTQDVLRMFLGGKRTTQEGKHRKVKMPSKLTEKMLKHTGPSVNMSEYTFTFDPAHVLAGFLIEKFFHNTEYLVPKTDIIETYDIKY